MSFKCGMRVLWLTLLVTGYLHSAGITLVEAEDSLARMHQQILKGTTNEARDSTCDKMRSLFTVIMADPGIFEYPFAKLKFCTLRSPDDRIRLFNWNLPYLDETHKYFCFVLLKDRKTGEFTWTELYDNVREGEKIENKFFTTDKWLGALYYDIIPMGKKGRTDTYTLLGWDGKDRLTTRKIVDAITITGNKIRIGAAIFNSEDGVRKRVILEYNDEVSASVKYYPKKNAIVLDHLSPKNPLMAGILADYGPDGSYDLLLQKKGKWEFIENIDISEFADGNDKPFYDPRSARKKQ